MKISTLAVAALLCSAAFPAHAHNGMTHQSTDKKWTLGYTYEKMHMEDMRDGSNDLSNAEVFARGFMMTQTEMNMAMHMLHAGYQPNHRLAFMAMLDYRDNDMTMIDNMGMTSTMKSNGIGDLKLSGDYQLLKGANSGLNATLGLSAPTGSIDEKSNTGARLPYMMQLGSGTWDPMIGLAYNYQYRSWAFGIGGNAVLRFGENDNGYRLGNEYRISLSAARPLSSYFTAQFRLDGTSTGEIEGMDASLMRGMSPENHGEFYGGERIDAVMGLKFHPPALGGSGLLAEVGLPLHQRANGPQLEQDYRFKLGGHFAF
ncbi:MAG TPA: transporter [Alphaproteobacteria bacterium]|nr:hypothetical protein [Rhodospirillaceae bacterium]HRJ12275.1 transporter [Alphaproteobacteria bacterium]